MTRVARALEHDTSMYFYKLPQYCQVAAQSVDYQNIEPPPGSLIACVALQYRVYLCTVGHASSRALSFACPRNWSKMIGCSPFPFMSCGLADFFGLANELSMSSSIC